MLRQYAKMTILLVHTTLYMDRDDHADNVNADLLTLADQLNALMVPANKAAAIAIWRFFQAIRDISQRHTSSFRERLYLHRTRARTHDSEKGLEQRRSIK
jgi:hypothetical protein